MKFGTVAALVALAVGASAQTPAAYVLRVALDAHDINRARMAD